MCIRYYAVNDTRGRCRNGQTGWPPLTKSRGWSWLQEAVCLWHGGSYHLHRLLFPLFCMKMDKRLSASEGFATPPGALSLDPSGSSASLNPIISSQSALTMVTLPQRYILDLPDLCSEWYGVVSVTASYWYCFIYFNKQINTNVIIDQWEWVHYGAKTHPSKWLWEVEAAVYM